jgi:hypothetical protein
VTAPAWPGGRVRPRRRTVVAVLAAALVLAVALAASAWHHHERQRWQAAHTPTRTEARAGDPDIPAIDWPNGLPDDGRWADDPWVATLRTYVAVEAAAYNTGDLVGSTDLRRLLADRYIESEQDQLTGERELAADERSHLYDEGWPVFPGPLTLTVLDVQQTDESAVVTTCRTSGVQQFSDASTLGLMSSTRGALIDWTLTLQPDGSRRITEIDVGTRCEVEDVHYGLFDPQPERLAPTEAPTAAGS